MRKIKRYDCCDRCGQLASANYGDGKSEDFLWDGLALVKRGGEQYINEPHVGGGNPVVSSGGTTYFNDMLGTTVGAKAKGKYSAAALTAFGENHLTTEPPNHQTFYTGKPYVAGLGHAFLFRNYRAGLAKWLTADPMGYPDGWNQLAYCRNGVVYSADLFGCFPISNIVEHELESAIENFFNENSVNAFIMAFIKSTSADDVHVYGYVALQITNIKIYYNHSIAGDTYTTADDYNFNTIIGQTIQRTQPDVYKIRNVAGDRNGASCNVGNGTAVPLDLSGLSISDSILGYSVTVTRITCDYNLMADIHSRYFNYVKE